MGLLRSHTTHHLSSHFHTTPSPTSQPEEPKPCPSSDPDSEPVVGLNRSVTDPVSKPTSSHSSHHVSLFHRTTPPGSGHSSGTSSPHRKNTSMDIVRNIRDRPTSAIPKYHVLAEQLHKYKMRNCQGMYATEEETAGISKMKKWDWKHAGHPGEAAVPVGPRDEKWHFEGVALEQVRPNSRRTRSG